MIFDKYPYTNFHEMNDDWVIQTLREFEKRLDEFVVMNSLTYADPIEYDPDTTYPANTVLIYNGTAYLTKVAAPAGVLPTNSDYYIAIFPFEDLIQRLVDEGVDAGVDEISERVDTYVRTELGNVPVLVNQWMNEHPEITTPIPDESVSFQKLNRALSEILLINYPDISIPTAIPNTDFVQGGIDYLTGEDLAATNACRTDFVTFPGKCVVVLRTIDHVVMVYKYTADGQFVGRILSDVNTQWNAFVSDTGYKFRFTIANEDLSDLTPEDLPAAGIFYFLCSNSAEADAAIKSAIASEYSSASTYNVNDYVFYSGALYRCVTAITTAEEWTAEHWTAVVLGNDVADLINYLGAGVYRSDKKTATSTYTAIIKANGNIEASTSSNAHLSIYPVEANKLYVLYGLSVRVSSTATALAVYSTSLFDGETTLTGNTIVVPSTTAATLTDYNVTFRPTADGYVYIFSFGNYNALELYDEVYRSTTLDNISVSTKPSESYDVSFADIFDRYESAFIDDFTTRESFVDTDHPYTILGSDADAPTITTGTGATRTGASGMATLAYSRTFNSFPYVCLIGRVASASQIIKVFDDSNSVIAGAISISSNGSVSYNSVTYGNIHVNAAFVVLVVNSDSVTVYDDSGIEMRIPVSYTSDKPMNIALGFGANAGRLFGYGSFVEFVKRPMQTLDFNRCVALNEDADSAIAAKSVIRFTHGIWDNEAVSTVYYKPSANPYMESSQGLSNNPSINCICDYAEDNGYRTEIGITPIKGSLKGKLGGLQRFHASADYFMASADNPGTNDFYTYIFQLHDANFVVQGWTDAPPFVLRVKDNRLYAFVCYKTDGSVPSGDNVHANDGYNLCDWSFDAWHHVEVEARIGWRNVLAPRLIVRVDGIERLNIETPLGYNIVSSGGFVNTHFGNYCPEWHSGTYNTKHSEVIVTNIRWEGTQSVN